MQVCFRCEQDLRSSPSHEKGSLMGCNDSMGNDLAGNGCRSCMTAMFRTPNGHESSGAESRGAADASLCGEPVCECGEFQGVGLILMSLTAFIGPLVVAVIVVQSLESRVGSLAAGVAGLAAAALTVLVCSGVVRRLHRPSEVAGADR